LSFLPTACCPPVSSSLARFPKSYRVEKPLQTPAFTHIVCQGWFVFIMCIFARMYVCMHACALYIFCIYYAVCVLYMFIYIYACMSHKLSFDELSGQPCSMRPFVFGRREKNTYFLSCTLCARHEKLQDYAIGTTNRSSIFIDEVYNPPTHPPTTPHYTHAYTGSCF
jgi:hypothetical protein